MGNACCAHDDPVQQVTQTKACMPSEEDGAPLPIAPAALRAVGGATEPETTDGDDPNVAAPLPQPKSDAKAANASQSRVRLPPSVQPQPTYTEPSPTAGAATLVINFRLPDGAMQLVTFVRRPLGLDFNRSNPITMKRVQPYSHGDELGVRAGWEIHTVNGEAVAAMTFDYTYNILREVSAQLPER